MARQVVGVVLGVGGDGGHRGEASPQFSNYVNLNAYPRSHQSPMGPSHVHHGQDAIVSSCNIWTLKLSSGRYLQNSLAFLPILSALPP